MKSKTLVWILLFLVLINGVLALGIRPAKTIIDFKPGLESEQIFNVLNEEGIDMVISLKAEGVLKDYIIFDQPEVEISAAETLKEVKFRLKLPQEMTPGWNEGQIIVTEHPKATAGTITANIELAHKVFVIAPYPEKYLEADFNLRIRETESDIILELRNSGSEFINNIQTLVEVYDNEEKIKEMRTYNLSLEPTQTKQYYLVVNHQIMGEGQYDVKSQIWYDEKDMAVTRKLLVGEPRIELVNLDKFFLEKEVNELNIELKSRWNQPIEDAYAEILVKKDGQDVYSARTVSFNLEGKETKVIKTYIDASKITVGQAELSINLNYNNKQETTQHPIEFLDEIAYNQKIKEVQVISMPGGKYTYILITIIALLLLITVLLLLLPKLKRKESERIEKIS